jgi:hypothetical protein
MSMLIGLLKQTLKTLFNMETHRKYYLDLRELLGSDYVLTDMSDEEVIGRLIGIIGGLNQDEEYREEVENLKAEIDNLEDYIELLKEQLEEARL